MKHSFKGFSYSYSYCCVWILTELFFLFFIIATPKIRHQHRHLPLYFQFEQRQETNNVVAQAIFHLYVHSEQWLRANEFTVWKQLVNHPTLNIDIFKLLQVSSNKNTFQSLFGHFSNISIPNRDQHGHYIQIDVTNMVSEWFLHPQSTHGLLIKINTSSDTQGAHKIVATDPSHSETVSFFILKKNIKICFIDTFVRVVKLENSFLKHSNMII